MKVLFDGFWMTDGPPSGRMVMTEIIRTWKTKYPGDLISVCIPANTSSASLNIPENIQLVKTRLRLHPLINFFELPLIAYRQRGFDAIICHNFSTPTKNSAVFLHDVLFQSNPEWFTRVERLYFGLMTILAKYSTVILTSSKSEKVRIETHNQALRNVVDTGLGLSRAFQNGTEPQPVPGLEHKSFLLSVGRLNARKNLGRTIDGALKSGVLSADFPLVVVGESSGKVEHLSEEARTAVIEGRILFLGFVDDNSLLWLYSHAKFLLFLSLGEGYGLPPVEAMVFGTRVLVSDLPIMRENLGDYGDYVDPNDLDAICHAIATLSSDDSWHGKSRSVASWERVVENIRDAVRDGNSDATKAATL